MPVAELGNRGRRIIGDPPPKDYELWVEFIKVNRKLNAIDTVICWGGKCKYECAWTALDNGWKVCVFAPQVYNWEEMGDTRFPKRGCVGHYGPIDQFPGGASVGTKLVLPIENVKPLEPFGA